MRKTLFIFVLILCSSLLLTACQNSPTTEHEQQASASTGYPSGEIQQPQVMYRDRIYCYRATGFDEALPSGYVCVGAVNQVDNMSAPTENLCGSRLAIGQKIFAIGSDADTIYIQYETGYAGSSVKETMQPTS